jgi:eukaryotic-like serine/threonine-protein kinase
MQAPEILGGRYELRGVLGRGGMAEVRDGWDNRLGRAVAVKLLHPVFSVQADNRRRFEVEARAAAALNHPHIVAVHDSGEHDGTPYIVMERLSGRTLADLVARGPLPQIQVRAILNDVLSALAVAHAAGTLHRDIKPGNILFTNSGDTKVADFGIAKTPAADHTVAGQIVGTMAYLSADRLAGRPATVADDLYAVGVVGYEALTGRRPFPQENLATLARAISEDRPPPLPVLRPDVDPMLASVIERAMARDPQWRFASAHAMLAALSGGSGAAPMPAPIPAPMRPPTRVLAAPLPEPTTMFVAPPVRPGRRRKLIGLAAVLAAIALAAVLVMFDSPAQRPPEPATTSTPLPTPVTSSFVTPTPVPPPTQVGPPGKKHKGGNNGNGDGGD